MFSLKTRCLTLSMQLTLSERSLVVFKIIVRKTKCLPLGSPYASGNLKLKTQNFSQFCAIHRLSALWELRKGAWICIQTDRVRTETGCLGDLLMQESEVRDDHGNSRLQDLPQHWGGFLDFLPEWNEIQRNLI